MNVQQVPTTANEVLGTGVCYLAASKRFYVDTLGFPVSESPHEFFRIDLAGAPICIDFDPQRHERSNIGIEVSNIPVTVTWLNGKMITHEHGSNPESAEEWVLTADPDGNTLVFLVHRQF